MTNIKLKQYTQPDDELVYISHLTFECGKSWEPHRHNYMEAELIVSGSGRHNLNGVEYEWKPGAVYILRPTDFHSITVDQDATLYRIKISESFLSPETLRTLAAVGSGISTYLDHGATDTAIALAELMYKEFLSETHSKQFIKNLLDCFIMTVLKNVRKTLPEYGIGQVGDAVTYINLHFIDNPSLAEAAAVAHYTPGYFSTVFRRVIGVSYSEYLRELKIKYSKLLLISTRLNISDIAYKSGFGSESNFLKTFRECTGTSPLKFRKTQARGNSENGR